MLQDFYEKHCPKCLHDTRHCKCGEKESHTLDKGVKHDSGKPRVGLMLLETPLAMKHVGAVLGFGAKKYGVNNAMKVENAYQRYMDSLVRHLIAHCAGEKIDAESGLPHLAHAASNIMFLLELESRNEHL